MDGDQCARAYLEVLCAWGMWCVECDACGVCDKVKCLITSCRVKGEWL